MSKLNNFLTEEKKKLENAKYVKEMNKEMIDLFSEEFHEIEMNEFLIFLNSQLNNEGFIGELESNYIKLENLNEINKLDVNLMTSKLISVCILLGFGRNRTLKILEKYDINRTMFEKTRNALELNENELRKENERQITSIKINTTKRLKRYAEINRVNWEALKEKYINGESSAKLAKEYKISGHMIVNQLKEESVFDEMRSSLTKNKVAKEKEGDINKDFIANLIRSNPLDSKEVLWGKAKEEYPWILRNRFFDIIEELGLARTAEEVNEIRRIKSKNMSNTDYAIKVNSHKAVREVFEKTDLLVKKYLNNELGSYGKIADIINDNITFDFQISQRQVERIVTNHPLYKPRKSAGQDQLFNFIKNTFPELEIIEEYSYTDTNKRIDVYIPQLRIGFEYNGEYWHSDEVIKHNYNKTSYQFHEERVEELKKQEIKLMYVWEDDWNNNYANVEIAIKNKKWNADILNKYENKNPVSIAPSILPGKLRYQITKFLNDNNINYNKENNSSLIEIKDYNIVIDVPGYSSLATKKRSINLQKQLEKEDVELLTFLPWDNILKVKEFLNYRLKLSSIRKVPARKCIINYNNKITNNQKEFFQNNHILGYNNFQNIDKTITLMYDNEVVIAALFTRKGNSETAELKRLVSAQGVAVQGGPSRLLKEYMRLTPNVKEIFTFSDCDLGFGGVYKTLGFELIERSNEQLTWFNEKEEMKFSNLSLVMVGADRLLNRFPNYTPVGIGEGLPSNQEIVQEYGFIPIYDSGYKKWSLLVNSK